jgi:hypothetical protein
VAFDNHSQKNVSCCTWLSFLSVGTEKINAAGKEKPGACCLPQPTFHRVLKTFHSYPLYSFHYSGILGAYISLHSFHAAGQVIPVSRRREGAAGIPFTLAANFFSLASFLQDCPQIARKV